MRKMNAMIAAAYLGGVVLAWNVGISSAWAQPGGARVVVGGNIFLQMGGVIAGRLSTVQGGYATAPVVVEAAGTDHVQRKHLGAIKYEDLVLTAGTGMNKGFYEAVRNTVGGLKLQRFDGTVIQFDGTGKGQSQRAFTGGFFSEVTFPGLDVAIQEAASITFRITPETTRTVQGAANAVVPAMQKKWLRSNFRLTIKGLEAACQTINTIEPISIKVRPPASSAGAARDSAVPSAVTTYSDLVVTFAEANGNAFVQWYDSFVVKGVNGATQEKEGTLEFLTPNLQEVLFSLKLGNIGIYRLTPVPMDNNSTIRRLKAEMYVETIEFDYKASWA